MSEVKKSRSFKQFFYKGKSLDELQSMPLSEFAKIIPSTNRRHLLRGINRYELDLLKKVEEYHKQENKVPIKTIERTMIIVPSMVNTTIAVHCGHGYFPVEIKAEMLGNKLKDYVPTKAACSHGRPVVGANLGAKFVPLK